MDYIRLNDKNYNMSYYYKSFRRAWVEELEEETRKLILDFTILWNMFEHQVFNNHFNSKTNLDDFIKIIKEKTEKQKNNYIYRLFKEYNNKFNSITDFYNIFNFKRSHISSEEIDKLYKSRRMENRLRLLIISCYRVRCNLFHGPNNILDLDNQKLLLLSMNELLSLVCRCYGF